MENKIFFKFLYIIVKKTRVNLINDHKTTNFRLPDFKQNYVIFDIKKLNILILIVHKYFYRFTLILIKIPAEFCGV